MVRVALVGDHDAAVTAHRAIPRALAIAARELSLTVESHWIPSVDADPELLDSFDALWCVPLSPYRDPLAVIAMIESARRRDLPFLGTCAGYQHAVLEFARNRLGLTTAESSEDNPETRSPVIHALSCGLIDVDEEIRIEPRSRLAEIYGCERALEGYHCNFGVNPEYLPQFAGSGFAFSAFDTDRQPRAFELGGHRFFFGTAFQPERSALAEKSHPLISAFIRAAI